MDWTMIAERLNRMLEDGQHGELRGALTVLNAVDISEYLHSLPAEKQLKLFRILPKDISADVFSYMDGEQRQALVGLISDGEIRTLMSEMYLDDAVDFLEELPASVVKHVLAHTDENTRDRINRFLQYPVSSAGSIMTIEFMEFHDRYTVRQAMGMLKRTALEKETVYVSYVIDDTRRLLGTVSLRKLLLAKDDKTVGEIMDSRVISVKTLDDQETVARLVRKYDLMALPVVDNEDRLVGIITADDVMDVIEAESTEDIEKMAALIPSEDEYLKTSIWRMAGNRIPWLMALMLAAIVSGAIITGYEDLLTASGAIGVMLTSSIPMLMDTGGNCGSQSSMLVIRGLALGSITLKDTLKVLWLELRVSVLVGAALAVVNFFRLTLTAGATGGVALVVSFSLYLTVILAKTIGAVLPIGAHRIKLDPAMMASPLLTNIVDAAALTIMFGIATKFLLP